MKKSLVWPVVVSLTLSLSWSSPANAKPSEWLKLLNAERTGSSVKLSDKDVYFAPQEQAPFGPLVAVGYRQTDGTLTLGSLLWREKVWSTLAGYGAILADAGFGQASDEQRGELFLALLRTTQQPLGIWLYEEESARDPDRPHPPSSLRQSDGLHRFVVWYCQEPGMREGPEWRRVLYLVDASNASVQARTLASFRPEAERLRGFPAIPSRSSE